VCCISWELPVVRNYLPLLGRSVYVSNWVSFCVCVCVCVCVCAEPALDGSRGVHPVYSLLSEGGHVQLRPLSVGAAYRGNSLRSLETW